MRKFLFLMVVSTLMFCFQNFGALSAEDLQTAQALQELEQFNSRAPASVWLSPQHGNDFESVTSDWVNRQGSQWLDGADQRWLDSMNAKLQTFFGDEESSTASTDNKEESESVNRSPTSLSFSRINSMEYRFKDNSRFHAAVELDGAHLDYQRRLSQNTHLGIEHKSSKNQTSFLFKYDWQ